METSVTLAIIAACVSGVSIIGTVLLGGGALATSIVTCVLVYEHMSTKTSEDTDIKIRKEHEETTDNKNQTHTVKHTQEITIKKDNDHEENSTKMNGQNGQPNEAVNGIIKNILPGILDVPKGGLKEETITTTFFNKGVEVLGKLTTSNDKDNNIDDDIIHESP